MRLFGFLAALLLVTGVATPAEAQKRATATKAKPAASKDWINVVTRTPEGGVRQGNPDAPVKLVEYGARTCPTCAAFAAEGVEPLREKYVATGKVSYEFRDFLIHGAADATGALLNLCVPLDRFFPVLDAMFATQRTTLVYLRALEWDKARHDAIEALPQAEAVAVLADRLGYLDFIKEQGVSEEKAQACLADPALLKTVNQAHAGGTAAGVRGTPNFLINGKLVSPYSWAALEPLLIAAIG